MHHLIFGLKDLVRINRASLYIRSLKSVLPANSQLAQKGGLDLESEVNQRSGFNLHWG